MSAGKVKSGINAAALAEAKCNDRGIVARYIVTVAAFDDPGLAFIERQEAGSIKHVAHGPNRVKRSRRVRNKIQQTLVERTDFHVQIRLRWCLSRCLQLFHLKQLDVEDQGGIRRNNRWRSGFAVCHGGRYEQAPFVPRFHELQCLGPTADDLGNAKLSGFTAIH